MKSDGDGSDRSSGSIRNVNEHEHAIRRCYGDPCGQDLNIEMVLGQHGACLCLATIAEENCEEHAGKRRVLRHPSHLSLTWVCLRLRGFLRADPVNVSEFTSRTSQLLGGSGRRHWSAALE